MHRDTVMRRDTVILALLYMSFLGVSAGFHDGEVPMHDVLMATGIAMLSWVGVKILRWWRRSPFDDLPKGYFDAAIPQMAFFAIPDLPQTPDFVAEYRVPILNELRDLPPFDAKEFIPPKSEMVYPVLLMVRAYCAWGWDSNFNMLVVDNPTEECLRKLFRDKWGFTNPRILITVDDSSLERWGKIAEVKSSMDSDTFHIWGQRLNPNFLQSFGAK